MRCDILLLNFTVVFEHTGANVGPCFYFFRPFFSLWMFLQLIVARYQACSSRMTGELWYLPHYAIGPFPVASS